MLLNDDKKRAEAAKAYIKKKEDDLLVILQSALDDEDEPSDEFIDRVNRLCEQYENTRNKIDHLMANIRSERDKDKLYAIIEQVYS